jgi:omega-hydroxy-beta-dihydromenaquinone-9 sulfotransferase
MNTTTQANINFSKLGYQLGLIGFTRLTNVLRLTHYAIGIHPRYLLRLILIVTSSLFSQPLRWWETMQYGQQIAKTELVQPPIFIIGHWRSGTTHLHNLLTQDPVFGYLSMYQAIVPECSLVGQNWLKKILARIVPEKRPMDNMVWPLDAPQEEEFPLAKMMPHAFYISFLFPSKTKDLFKKYVLMQGASPQAITEFKQNYYKMLQIATIHAGGKRLILKNPVNTARVRLLLELFPDAKFIHICRSPYDVFASARQLQQKLLSITTLQTINSQNAEDTVLTLYEYMMQNFFAQRTLIPLHNLVEVRYEDLEKDPLRELRRIYENLHLPGYSEAESAFCSYLDSQRSYRKNNNDLSEEDCKHVEHRWAFAFKELRYASR